MRIETTEDNKEIMILEDEIYEISPMNVVKLFGTIVDDVYFLEGKGKPRSLLRLQVERLRKGKHSYDEFDIVAWFNMAYETADNVQKGDKVCIIAEIRESDVVRYDPEIGEHPYFNFRLFRLEKAAHGCSDTENAE